MSNRVSQTVLVTPLVSKRKDLLLWVLLPVVKYSSKIKLVCIQLNSVESIPSPSNDFSAYNTKRISNS